MPKELLNVISRKDAEAFLVDLVNFNADVPSAPGARQFFKRWGDIFTAYHLEEAGALPQMSPKVHLHWFLRNELVPVLRMAWDAPTPREQAWYAHLVREIYNVERVKRSDAAKKLEGPASRKFHGNREMTEFREHERAIEELKRLKQSLPPVSKFDAAAQHFEGILSRSSHCQNPVCAVTPYYLATKVGQKYCSETCARPAQQAAKKKWWDEHGTGWRNEQKGKKKRGKA
jgi:hypothetical protein